MNKKISDVCYKYKDGRFLKISHMGDGDYELILTNEITSDCLFTKAWSLSEILGYCDNVYDDSGEHIEDILDENDFAIRSAEITIVE